MNESAILPGVHLYVCLVYVEYNVSHDLGWRIRVTKVAFFCDITPALQSVCNHTNPVQTSTR